MIMPIDYAGNDLSTSRSLDITPKNQAFTDWLGSGDNQDYYSFRLSGRSSFKLKVDNLLSNVDVQLLDSSGAEIASSSAQGKRAERIRRNLDAGDYYIKVYGIGDGETSYRLSVNGNSAPSSLSFSTDKASYQVGETVSLTQTKVFDGNGVEDLKSVDFWLRRDGEKWTNVSDAVDFSANTEGSFSFEYILNDLDAGKYKLWGKAKDNTGAKSNSFVTDFEVQAVNYAPSSLGFSTDKASYQVGETVSLTQTKVFDGNGVEDLKSVDFWLRRDGGTWIDVSDAVDFSTNSEGSFSFEYSLNDLDAGEYQIWARAEDRAGVFSNAVLKSFTVQEPININQDTIPTTSNVGDWFDQNIQDVNIRQITRSFFADNQLDRNEMINIFNSAKDESVVDATELQDLRTLVNNTSDIIMPEYVRVLSNKVVNDNRANQNYQGTQLGNLSALSSDVHLERLIDKWFRGGDRPTAEYSYYRADGSISSTPFIYRQAQGTLFQDGASYRDIKQGIINDCYFLTGLAAATIHSPDTINSMFIDNGDDTFTVRFYINGVADYLTVDKYLPTNANGTFVYANQGSHHSLQNELWVALAEKAYAQLNESGQIGQDGTNSYYGIGGGIEGYGGYMYDAFAHITGSDSYSQSLDRNEIVRALESGRLVGLGSKPTGVAANLVASHAYTVVNYNSSNQTFTLFNPNGTDGNSSNPRTLEISWNEIQTNFDYWDTTNSIA